MKPLVIAHRGENAINPENTLSAVRGALKHGVDLIEIDVQLSSDGHVVVMHDTTVDRTTHHSGKVKSFKLEHLKQMDAGAKKHETFKGEKIPTLDEVLEVMLDKEENKKGAKLLIELKFQWFSWTGALTTIQGLEKEVVQIVQARKAQEIIIIQSFVEEYLSNIRNLDSNIPVHLLVFPWRMLFPSSVLKTPVDSFNLLHHTVSKSFIDLAKGLNKTVYVWTVDSKEDMERCISLGVDGIITNQPMLLREVIKDFDPSTYQAGERSDKWFIFSLLAATAAIIYYLVFGPMLKLRSRRKEHKN